MFVRATITVVARDTVTAVVSCSTAFATGTGNPATLSPNSAVPAPTPILKGVSIEGPVARQDQACSYSSITTIGPIPAYIGSSCATLDSVYASACACKGVTSSTLSKISTVWVTTKPWPTKTNNL